MSGHLEASAVFLEASTGHLEATAGFLEASAVLGPAAGPCTFTTLDGRLTSFCRCFPSDKVPPYLISMRWIDLLIGQWAVGLDCEDINQSVACAMVEI